MSGSKRASARSAVLGPSSGSNPSLYKEGLLKNMIGFSENGMMSMKAAENVYKVLVKFEPSVQKAGKMDLSKTFDNSFVQKANAKYH
jgi:hypothetical protein